MANGSLRIAQANMILANKPATTEQAELMNLSDKNSKLPKYPLKAGKKDKK